MTADHRIPQAEIQAEHIRTLFRPGYTTIFIAYFITGAVLVFILWDTAPQDSLLTWLAALYSMALIRILFIRAYRQHPPSPEAAPRWGVITAVLTGIFGIIWGLAPILFLDPAQPASLIAITLILNVICVGGTVAFSSYPPAFITFAVPILTSLATVLWLRGGKVGMALAILVALNLLINLIYLSNVHRALNESLRLRFENIALRRETEEKSALLETTLQNMQQGISVIDQEGRLRMWNQHFLDLLGLGDRQPDAHHPLDTVLRSADPPLPGVPGKRIEYRRSNGIAIEILPNAMPDGGRVLTYADISDLKRREEALEAARQVAEQANTAKTRFLATASHDLRQPTHALGLFFAALAEKVRNAETEPLIKPIEDAIDAVDNMLNALLDISKLDAGVVQPKIGPVAMAGLFQRLEAEYQSMAQENGNTLRVRPCQAIVQSDAAMLERMLRNLIANALRYTFKGRVLVAARQRGTRLRIEVYDTGSGIPASKLDDIFQEFYQLGNPERDRRQGLGLGLAIVKRLATLLGHEITVRSRLGHGSRFAITVPLARKAPRQTSLPAPPLRGLELKDRRVLVLDDNTTILAAMESLLSSWGCQVSTASSLEEARKKIGTSVLPPELLIVDYRLRGQASGLNVAAALQAVLGQRVPVLVITGDTAPDRLREAQASGYPLLHKPVPPAKLRSIIYQLIGL
ncbi:MAG TPA: NahK/ErcS family hybrid sensor histidine kinase/response regulator [Candidatus Competibacteraceae bacterium]|nr:NahK/ErcS family hybrid sensor histidine kinase/response regulator [Candidatus Competibacteraceae bacterium]